VEQKNAKIGAIKRKHENVVFHCICVSCSGREAFSLVNWCDICVSVVNFYGLYKVEVNLNQ
jgi:hypothetical protein